VIVVDFRKRRRSFDAVSAKGEFLGGAIAPGIEISVEGAGDARGTAAEDRADQSPRSIIGKNTVECMQSGILYGFRGGRSTGVVHRMAEEMAEDPDDVDGGRHRRGWRRWCWTSPRFVDVHEAVADAGRVAGWSMSGNSGS